MFLLHPRSQSSFKNWLSGKNCYSSGYITGHLIKPVMMSPQPQHHFRSYYSHCFYNFSLFITVILKTVNTNCMFVWPSTKNSRVTDLVPVVVLLLCFIFITMRWKTCSYYWNPSERDLITWKNAFFDLYTSKVILFKSTIGLGPATLMPLLYLFSEKDYVRKAPLPQCPLQEFCFHL